MTQILNQYGQPVGRELPNWTPREYPSITVLEGKHTRLEKLDPTRHARDLYEAYQTAEDGRDWTYLGYGPFESFDDYQKHVNKIAFEKDPFFYAVIDKKLGKPVGVLSLMRMDLQNGSIEVGHVAFSPLLRRSRVSTEAQYLLMMYSFETLGYRRYEWKADSLNGPSNRAAKRLGFKFEGIFRNHVVYKGRSRDTSWLSITDEEYPLLKEAFVKWLSDENFDQEGNQINKLEYFRN